MEVSVQPFCSAKLVIISPTIFLSLFSSLFFLLSLFPFFLSPVFSFSFYLPENACIQQRETMKETDSEKVPPQEMVMPQSLLSTFLQGFGHTYTCALCVSGLPYPGFKPHDWPHRIQLPYHQAARPVQHRHIFISLWATCISTSEECLSKFFAPLLLRCWIFFLSLCKSSLYMKVLILWKKYFPTLIFAASFWYIKSWCFYKLKYINFPS